MRPEPLEYDDTLRERLTENLARHRRRVLDVGDLRHAAVAVVLVDSTEGEDRIDPVYEATVQATEEAIINAMLAAKTMRGADGYVVPALPHDRLKEVLRKYGRLPR